MIKIAGIHDLNVFKKIYIEYIRMMYTHSLFTEKEIMSIVDHVKTSNLLESILDNPECKVLLAVDNGRVCGFLQAQINVCDYMFEKPHIYIANLFLRDEIVDKRTILLYEMYEQILFWAKSKGIKYICNDVDDSNERMKRINVMLHFTPYRSRYFMEINDEK